MTTVTATFTVDNEVHVLQFCYKDLATCFVEIEHTAKQFEKNHSNVTYKLSK